MQQFCVRCHRYKTFTAKKSIVIVKETKTFLPKFGRIEEMKQYCTKGNNSILMAKEKIWVEEYKKRIWSFEYERWLIVIVLRFFDCMCLIVILRSLYLSFSFLHSLCFACYFSWRNFSIDILLNWYFLNY